MKGERVDEWRENINLPAGGVGVVYGQEYEGGPLHDNLLKASGFYEDEEGGDSARYKPHYVELRLDDAGPNSDVMGYLHWFWDVEPQYLKHGVYEVDTGFFALRFYREGDDGSWVYWISGTWGMLEQPTLQEACAAAWKAMKRRFEELHRHIEEEE